jgi:23S rRNA (cytidine2498-2'-O)-methyltransferase
MTGTARFVFALAQPATASWLKQDVVQRHPTLRFAFSRPGLYTFKLPPDSTSSFELRTVFARHWGFSLGNATNAQQIYTLASATDLPWSRGTSAPRLRLFVSLRDEGEERMTAVDTQELDAAGARVQSLQHTLLDIAPSLFHATETPALGDWVLDVVVPLDPAEALFVGYHRHDTSYGKVPGGIARILPPKNVPSRAYSKLQEALAWSELPLSEGQHAVEIGCAPGGAVLALLERGLQVTGIDPADMAPELEPHTQRGAFVHLKRPVGEITQQDLPERAQWLLCDANLAPQTALRYVTRIAKLLRPQLRGIIFTIKLNDDRVVLALPKLFEALGCLSRDPQKGLRVIQLPSHRREIVAVIRV